MANSKEKPVKKEDKTSAAAKTPLVEQPSSPMFEKERAQFKALLLSNPNYFGNLPDSKFKPVLKIQGNPTYEEIGCVGFQPQFNLLEAVVFVKQQSGYGGGLCSNGTQEYVRFYLSYNNGASWLDQGVTSFTAYDIPHKERLEYAVSLEINPRRTNCSTNNIVLVRAILSWNVEPPPNSPNVPPIWGSVHNTHILIAPLLKGKLGDFLKDMNLAMSDEMSSVLNLTQDVEAAQPQTPGAAELQKLYAGTKVEPHRYALAEVSKLMDQPLSPSLLTGGEHPLVTAKIDLSAITAKLLTPNGNTTYEQLECVGLNPNLDTLVGTIRVKLQNGYSGNLCSGGSQEYVAFWADYDNNGTFDTYLGTTSVMVNDVAELPKGGLEYAVFLPVNFIERRRPCKEGPVYIGIRAVLSWSVPPSTTDPNLPPVWGNHEDTLVHLRPGKQVKPGTHPPIIETVGKMIPERINTVTGLASGASEGAFSANNSPFGGWVYITGRIAFPTNISAGAAPLKYKVWVKPDGGGWQPRIDSFPITRRQLLGGSMSLLPPLTQSVDANNYYDYQEDATGSPSDALIYVTDNLLYPWNTNGLTGRWQIKIDVIDPADPMTVFTSDIVTVRLDDLAPVLSLDITSGGGACADFTIGDLISGSYSAFDEHFGGLSLTVEPSMGGVFTAPAGTPGPSSISRSYPTVPTAGEAGTWILNTAGMPRCGYIIRLSAGDRTIVDSAFVGRGNNKVVGLCLREKGK